MLEVWIIAALLWALRISNAFDDMFTRGVVLVFLVFGFLVVVSSDEWTATNLADPTRRP